MRMVNHQRAPSLSTFRCADRIFRALRLALLMACALGMSYTAHALPVYSRQYHVTCGQCHTYAPKLNKFGYAFQANFFNWPGEKVRPKADPTTYFPVSAITTYSYQRDISGHQDTAQIRAFELYLTSGFGSTRRGRGGYFVDLHLDDNPGNLEDAYFSFPFAGRSGQLALTVGQATPMLFQVDPVNSLTDTLPFAFKEGSDNFAWDQTTPVVRFDYFDHRGQLSPDGNYLSVGLPFRGSLSLTRAATLGPQSGVFLHGFHRNGFTTYGALAYLHKDASQFGLVGTYAATKKLYLTAIGTIEHEPGLNTTHTALEAEYLLNSRLAFTGTPLSVAADMLPL